VPHDYVQPVQRNASSGIFLLPASAAWGASVIVSDAARNYTAADWPLLVNDLGTAAPSIAAVPLRSAGPTAPALRPASLSLHSAPRVAPRRAAPRHILPRLRRVATRRSRASAALQQDCRKQRRCLLRSAPPG
jgi:hypothetical protein